MTSLTIYLVLQSSLQMMLLFTILILPPRRERPRKRVLIKLVIVSWLWKNNADKGEAMKFSRARNHAQCNHSIDHKPIARSSISTHRHLGVVLFDDLSWEPHILSTVARSNRLLDLLKRSFGSHREALLKRLQSYDSTNT